MSYNLGSFNREGQIGEAEAVELEAAKTDDEITDNEPASTSEPIQVTTEGEFVDKAASDSDAAKSDEVETEVVDADADGDGHDDQTGEFVEGNQEAADSVADEEA